MVTPKEAVEEKRNRFQSKAGHSLLFDSSNNSIDSTVPEYGDAELLKLPRISLGDPVSIDGLIDSYAELYNFEELAKLLYLTSPKGLGYTVETAAHWIDDWEVDHKRKIIYLDDAGILSGSTTNREAAEYLKNAIAEEFEGQEGFWDTAWRITKGTGITILGGLEILVGVVGILAPEPTAATKVAGAAVIVFGASTVVEGVTQIFNANNGQGINPLAEGFAAVGDWAGGHSGELWARRAFVFTNILVSIGGSYSILKVPGTRFLMKGTANASGKLYKEGYTVGRLQLYYDIPKAGASGGLGGGKVWINVLNNSGQWVVRFQTVAEEAVKNGLKLEKQVLVMNGRIINAQKWHRIDNPLTMLKILGKLSWHGFKLGVKRLK